MLERSGIREIASHQAIGVTATGIRQSLCIRKVGCKAYGNLKMWPLVLEQWIGIGAIQHKAIWEKGDWGWSIQA